MKLSIVATLFNSAETLPEFHKRISTAIKHLGVDSYEIVLVDDGSSDITLSIAIQLLSEDCHIRVIELSQNFGHHKAMLVGLSQAQGNLIFLIDSDLEEDPMWVCDFTDRMNESDADVVFGVQTGRKGGFFERHLGEVFYKTFNALSEIKIPRNLVVARLMTRNYVDALLLFQEREIFIGGLWYAAGFKQIAVPVVKSHKGRTTYTFPKKFAQAASAITSFSSRPLVWIFVSGIFLSVASVLFLAYLFSSWVLSSTLPSGYTSIIASVITIGSFLILSNGIIGLYLARVFNEVKQRPIAIVRRIYERDA